VWLVAGGLAEGVRGVSRGGEPMTSLWAWFAITIAVVFVGLAVLAVEETWSARRRR
jgi:hypothetical protein